MVTPTVHSQRSTGACGPRERGPLDWLLDRSRWWNLWGWLAKVQVDQRCPGAGTGELAQVFFADDQKDGGSQDGGAQPLDGAKFFAQEGQGSQDGHQEFAQADEGGLDAAQALEAGEEGQARDQGDGGE